VGAQAQPLARASGNPIRLRQTRALFAAGSLASLTFMACSTHKTDDIQQPPAHALTLEEATLADVQTAMRAGRETAQSLVDRHLARIAQIDREGPALRSVLEINPDARAIAAQLDAERAAGRVRGPLHGVPVLLKDNIATGDRLQTTAGSLALEGRPAAEDAFLVTRLRDAGAIVLGKSNLSEWANLRSLRSSSGWSGRGGQTKNPYALDRSPSGSSSGSAVAVAASLAILAVGTETDGSIVSPASLNGIVGIKPTLGLVSRRGLVPIAHSQDTAGPMARTVADAAALLGVLAGTDSEDPSTVSADRRGHRDYLPFLDASGLRGARLGVVRGLFGASPGSDAAANGALLLMRQQGAVLVDPVEIPTLGTFTGAEFELLLSEFGPDLEAYLRRYHPGGPVQSLRDVIRFNESHAERELNLFGQELLLEADARRRQLPRRMEALRAALLQQARAEGLDAAMDRDKLDALVAPTEGPAWLIDHAHGDPRMPRPATSTLPAVAGYPHITVPMGSEDGLPLGLSFIGRAWSEPVLLKIAYAFERATLARRPPTFPLTAPARR
jgi:amidase